MADETLFENNNLPEIAVADTAAIYADSAHTDQDDT
jgi:hypothetical protein